MWTFMRGLSLIVDVHAVAFLNCGPQTVSGRPQTVNGRSNQSHFDFHCAPHATPCFAMRSKDMQCHATQVNATPCNATQCNRRQLGSNCGATVVQLWFNWFQLFWVAPNFLTPTRTILDPMVQTLCVVRDGAVLAQGWRSRPASSHTRRSLMRSAQVLPRRRLRKTRGQF